MINNDINIVSDSELYSMLCKDKRIARKAFDELYSRYSQRIYTFCLKYLGNKELAEDIFQEVFAKLHTSSQNKLEVKNVPGFLMTVARNLCYNEYNRKKETVSLVDDYESGYSENTLENKELGKIIEFAIDTLPEHLREVVILREYLDMSYNEISEAMKIPMSSVRVHLYRAKEKLRSILTPYLNDFEEDKNEKK
ncbi:MAG: RNA polymerase sigma factor [Candidatus Kapabacteria bacterium]|nr:RNA polymerase sigma factor [Ignavibacteriota bacterium]MCW5885078.1 RNA polymerase sigma factor [Candidatus Kapabacteria bacterium]